MKKYLMKSPFGPSGWYEIGRDRYELMRGNLWACASAIPEEAREAFIAENYCKAIEIPEGPAPEWMSQGQKRDFWEACWLIDQIDSPEKFYRIMDALEKFSVDVVNCARYEKRCYNSMQYA